MKIKNRPRCGRHFHDYRIVDRGDNGLSSRPPHASRPLDRQFPLLCWLSNRLQLKGMSSRSVTFILSDCACISIYFVVLLVSAQDLFLVSLTL